jgi:hypothetical protein
MQRFAAPAERVPSMSRSPGSTVVHASGAIRGRVAATVAAAALVFAAVQVVVASPASATGVGFGKSALSGVSKTRPTSLQFGPDGRLYVLYQDGTIKILTVARNAANSYAVTATSNITSIKTIPNHNDTGASDNSFTAMSCTAPCRQATGMLVTGTAARPVIYVSSSDPRYGGGTRGDLNLDTNSGIVSRLTYNPTTSAWSKVDLVRGLPRSEENHAVNGLALDASTNTLYLGVGGHTNEGAPSKVFAYLPEYALSAAVLSIDLDAIGSSTYDLPTLDDPSRSNDPNRPGWDVNDPFGGNDGANQARIVPGGPVQVYASGFRNPYDLLFGTVGGHAGKMYVTDNGYNAGQGGIPVGEGTSSCTNDAVETSPVTGFDSIHYVTGPGYYAGHPNPTRGSTANTFGGQSPVPSSHPVECDFRASATSADPTPNNGAIASDISSTNGIAEYTASNFGGAMRGDLITAEWDGYVDRFRLTSDGTAVTDASTLFSAVSTHPLDLTTLGDGGPFPGTIWLGDHGTGTIYVFEPNDYGGGSTTCTGADDPSLDEDGDGYTNADEIDNGTDPCSGADAPADWDGDKVSNLNDPDDDNDGAPDTSDAWAIDHANGTATVVPVNHPFDDSGDPNAGGLLNLGFTGLMTNGVDDYASLYDPTRLTAGGAGGVLTIDQVGAGDALGAADSQAYGFQYGFRVASAHGSVFTPHTRILSPFAGVSPAGTESMGLQFGTGDQDNYVKLVVSAANGGSIALVKEIGGSVVATRSANVTLSSTGSVDVFLAVNPANHTLQPSYQLRNGTTTGARTQLGGALTLPSGWFSRSALATGVIATSGGAAPFPATWDMFEIQLPQYRPDGMVKLTSASSYTGNNVYNSTGTNQTVSSTTAAGTTTSFTINVQNDGAVSDSYVVHGPGSSNGFTVRYFSGTTDITTAVVNGTYTTTSVAAGGTRTLEMRVTVGATATTGSSKTSLVSLTSTHAGSATDAVRTTVTAG